MLASGPRTVSALSGAVVTPPGADKSQPAPLRPFSRLEWGAVFLFLVVGGVLIYFALHDFQHHLTGGKFVSKKVMTLASKRVEETDYSDSFEILALTAGVMLIVLAGLYGRIRDVTLGAMKVELADEDESVAGAPVK